MTDTERTGDWKGKKWAGEEPVRTTDDPQSDRWNKDQYVGDQGDGAPVPQDPDTMPEGETSISGNRHTPGEQHWAPGDPGEPPNPTTDPTPRR
jgi:hypothetical protein